MRKWHGMIKMSEEDRNGLFLFLSYPQNHSYPKKQKKIGSGTGIHCL